MNPDNAHNNLSTFLFCRQYWYGFINYKHKYLESFLNCYTDYLLIIKVMVFWALTSCCDVGYVFRRPCMLPSSSGWSENRGAWSSETLVSYHVTTQCNSPEDHHHEDLKSCNNRPINHTTIMLHITYCLDISNTHMKLEEPALLLSSGDLLSSE